MADAGAVAAPAAAGDALPPALRQSGLPARPRAASPPRHAAADAAPLCAKCGRPAARPRDCEHTGWAAYCTECYVELHYYLTEPAGADGR